MSSKQAICKIFNQKTKTMKQNILYVFLIIITAVLLSGFRKNEGKYIPGKVVSHRKMTSSTYQEKFDHYRSKGYRLQYIDGYAVGSSARFAAIWEKGKGFPLKARHNMTTLEYQQARIKYPKQGYRLIHVDGYSVDGTPHFAAIWEKKPGHFPARHNLSQLNYQSTYGNFKYSGHFIRRIAGYEVGRGVKYAAIWENAGISPTDQKQIKNRVKAFMDANNIKGLSIAITKNRKLVYAQGFGKADTKTGELVSPRHRFRIGSISKPLTATAIMQLVEQGKLSLDDAVFGGKRLKGKKTGTYYPSQGVFEGREYGTMDLDWYRDDQPKKVGIPHDSYIYDITVRHLLEHTSGSWSSRHPKYKKEKDPSSHFKKESHDNRIKKTIRNTRNYVPVKPLTDGEKGLWIQRAPGTVFAYSNFGYHILGRIIKKKSDMSYREYIKKHVLKPIDITDMEIHGTYWSPRSGEFVAVTKNKEVSYYRGEYAFVYVDDEGETHEIGSSVDGHPYEQYDYKLIDASGGWIGSAIDLVKFGMQFDETGTVLLDPSSIEIMKTPQSIPLKEGDDEDVVSEYGKGWGIPIWNDFDIPSEKRSIWRHGGAVNGVRSYLRGHEGVPNHEDIKNLDHFGFAILINTGPGCVPDTAACHAGSLYNLGASIIDIAQDEFTNTMTTDVAWPDYDLF